jgi:hypothetical protein
MLSLRQGLILEGAIVVAGAVSMWHVGVNYDHRLMFSPSLDNASFRSLDAYRTATDKVSDVTGTDISAWHRTFTIETGTILPGQAQQIGETACQALHESVLDLRRDRWSVVVKGGTGVVLYRCFV